MDISLHQQSQDAFFMKEALKEAVKAFEKGEIPIGALVVSPDGEIIGKGHNLVELSTCQLYHAEICALKEACAHQSDWRLDNHTVYVTLEPCMMCISLCSLSRIERVVYGAESPLFGFRLDKSRDSALYTKHIKNITGGVEAQGAAVLLKDFFSQIREN